MPHSSPSCLASRRSFIHAWLVTVVPRESARGCLPIPPAIITSLYIIISQWTILFVNNLLAFTIRGSNLKLRNHSRELIMGPRACPRARCTSRRPRHVHVVHWAYFLSSAATASTKEEEELLSLLFCPFLADFPIARRGRSSRSRSTRARLHALRISASTAMTITRSWHELSPAVYPLFSYCGLLRTDCCVFLSSNEPDRRSRPPTRPRYRSSSRICSPIPPCGNFPRVRHTGIFSSLPEMCDARRGFLSPSLHTFRSCP